MSHSKSLPEMKGHQIKNQNLSNGEISDDYGGEDSKNERQSRLPVSRFIYNE